jgi:hypothetical protein
MTKLKLGPQSADGYTDLVLGCAAGSRPELPPEILYLERAS